MTPTLKMKFNIPVKGITALAVCLSISAALFAQDKVYPIKTTAKPDDLKTYEIGTDGSINLLFTKKGKKHDVYSNYVFDKDLNLVTEVEEEMDAVKAKSTSWSRGFGASAEGGGIIRDSVLSVENNNLGQFLIMTGYIGWRSTVNPMNGATMTSQGFVAREKIKVKDESGRAMSMVGFQTDAPAEFFATGTSAGGGSMSRSIGMDGQKRVSSSTGDVMVVSILNTIGTKDPNTGEKIVGNEFKYVAQRFSAKTLEKLTETTFEFKYSSAKLHNQAATDNSNDMLLIFAPTHGATKQFSNPDKNEYEYIRIGVDTKLKERAKFNSPYGRLNNICIYNFGNETIIMATSKEGNESKFASFVPYKGNDDQLIIIRIKNGETPVLKAVPIKTLAAPVVSFAAGEAMKTDDNQIWITGQTFEQKGSDPAEWGSAYAFSIAPDGSITKQLVLPLIEKASARAASPLSLIKLNDGSLLWSTYEFTKKGNMYPKYAKISNGTLGTVMFPGEKKYVVNDKFSSYIDADKKNLIYFGNTEDNKQFWLHKESL